MLEVGHYFSYQLKLYQHTDILLSVTLHSDPVSKTAIHLIYLHAFWKLINDIVKYLS